MTHKLLIYLCLVLAALMTNAATAGGKDKPDFEWRTVVNNNDVMPPLDVRHFNSYNPPSVNFDGMVVIRARSRGGHGGGGQGGGGDHGGGGQGGGGDHGAGGDQGGEDVQCVSAGGSGHSGGQPTHGIYVRDMSRTAGPIERILDRSVEVPQPNNLGTTFVETPSFPRIDMHSDTIASRGNHRPVHCYVLDDESELDEESETRAGTTGIYTNPYGELITGAAKLGDAPGYGFFRVPEFNGAVRFEVFPGAPSITNGSTIVFKGNYMVDDAGKTGVYFRHLLPDPAGGDAEAVMIANNIDTLIPGTATVFGSTAPPNAAAGKVVFAGFDDEDAPTLGGIYLAPLQFQPPLTTLVSIGGAVPGETNSATFTALGEGISFDGRKVGFWGAWGEETRKVRLDCAEEGNRDMIAYCNKALVCSDSGATMGDPESDCDDKGCYVDREVPVNQGIFVHDIKTHQTHVVAKTGDEFDEFLFWKYSGKPPCAGEGHSEEGGEEDGESVRWRSSAFLSVGGPRGAAFRAAFKARTTEDVLGIYMKKGPGNLQTVSVADTTMDGQLIDPEAPADSTVVEVGLEREGLRGHWLAINAKMGVEGGEEEDGMAGIYITRVP